MSPDMVARTRERLSSEHGMPMGSEAVTEPPATIDAAAADAGIDAVDVDRRLADPDVEAALRADMAATQATFTKSANDGYRAAA